MFAPKGAAQTPPPRRDATAKLLLLLARPTLTEAQQQQARAYASEVSDWDDFAQLATQKFVSALAFRHLQSCSADLLPAGVIPQMKQAARASAMATLRVASAHAAFHRQCIEPTNAKHAYLKGLALASLSSSRLGERYCRDVDVLVSQDDFPKVVQTAVLCGYSLFIDDLPGRAITKPDEIAFVCHHADVVSLVGRAPVAIDVHRRLDKRHVRFDLDEAFATTEAIRLAEVECRTLSKAMHFNYFCYHHARHFWSHLHWVTDLNAVSGRADLDRADVLRIADEIGIRPTIDAAFEFSALTQHPNSWDAALLGSTGGAQFLRACLINLNGGMEIEEELRAYRPSGDIAGAWQTDSRRKLEFMVHDWQRRLRIRPIQYFRRRAPRWLYWTYRIENMFMLMRGVATGFVKAALRLG